jgi:hypothetical protein
MKRRTLVLSAATLALMCCAAAVPLGYQAYLVAQLDGWGTVPVLAIEDTTYARGHSHEGFRRVRVGMTERQVEDHIGRPLIIRWRYPQFLSALGHSDLIDFDGDGRVNDPGLERYRNWTAADIQRLLGEPAVVTWCYSHSPGDHSFRVRCVQFRGGAVASTVSELYWD